MVVFCSVSQNTVIYCWQYLIRLYHLNISTICSLLAASTGSRALLSSFKCYTPFAHTIPQNYLQPFYYDRYPTNMQIFDDVLILLSFRTIVSYIGLNTECGVLWLKSFRNNENEVGWQQF